MDTSRFPTTSWTDIREAASTREVLERLLPQYWRPIYAFFFSTVRDTDRAQDLTQAFMADRLIAGDVLVRADAARGRFRSFLKACLRNFAVDELRRERGRSDTDRPIEVPSDPVQLAEAQPGPDDPPDVAFDRQFAATVLTIVIERVEAACRHDGLGAHWAAFEARVLRPLAHGNAAPSIPSLVRELDAGGCDEVSHMIFSVKRRFRTTWEAVVAETLEGFADHGAESEELLRILS
ncbi:MAG: sigma-70 family RNA polymerase sigma factor [bacterium]|nr:sigma-70 family RNA polymerase sigma factor [bacterium]